MKVLVYAQPVMVPPTLKVFMQRPSIWTPYCALYDLFILKAEKGHTYTDRDICAWMTEKDKKQHSPSFVYARMSNYFHNGEKRIARSVDEKTGKFVGWRRTA